MKVKFQYAVREYSNNKQQYNNDKNSLFILLFTCEKLDQLQINSTISITLYSKIKAKYYLIAIFAIINIFK